MRRLSADVGHNDLVTRHSVAADPATHGARGFEVAFGYLEQGILDGKYSRGSQLPPERILAAQLGVGRGAVREAIRVLQAQGIVVSETGPGNGTRIQTAPVGALGRMLRLHIALGAMSFSDLTETRVALERVAATVAARTGEAEPLARAEHLIELSVERTSIEEFNDLDTQFHVAIAEAGRNRLIHDLSVAIRQAAEEPIRQAEEQLAEWDAVRRLLIDEHRAILAAVRTGAVVAAADRAEAHIRHAYAVLVSSS